MPMTLGSSVTGASAPSLTTPGFTLASMPSIVDGSAAYAVTALTGTQTGVSPHTLSQPYTVTFYTNLNVRVAGNGDIPLNKTRVMARKGVKVDALGTLRQASVEVIVKAPAGSETFDGNSLESLISMTIGSLSQASPTICNSVTKGL